MEMSTTPNSLKKIALNFDQHPLFYAVGYLKK